MEQEFRCPVYKKCGGCQLDVMYPQQLSYKQRIVIGLLGRFHRVEPIIGMEEPLHYRCKVSNAMGFSRGQVISGVLGDKIKPTDLIFYGLVTAVACNVAMFFCTSITAMAIVWCINGLAHALLWPPMVRLLASNLSDEQYLYSVPQRQLL